MKLNLMGPLTTQTGYGIVVTNFFLELIKQGVDVTLWPVLNKYDCLPKNKEVVQKALKQQESFSVDAPCLRIYHQFSMAESIGRGKRIGMPIFELDKFSLAEKNHLSSLDKIIVNSKWAAEVIKNNGINVPTSIVGLGHDPSVFFPAELSNKKTFVFLNVGKWSMNKGHDVLKTIWENAFSEDDNVELWLACHNHFLTEQENIQWQNYYRNSKLGGKVRFIPWLSTQDELANLMRQADVGVFPARGEGWNLEALEMMACGKQVIATNYSGQADFAGQYAIDINETESAYDGKWFFNQGNWAKLDDNFIELFISSMQRRYNEYKFLGRQHSGYSLDVARKYTWKEMASSLITEIMI